jgi:hypothetical protein
MSSESSLAHLGAFWVTVGKQGFPSSWLMCRIGFARIKVRTQCKILHWSLESWDGKFLVDGELCWSQRLVASKDIWASNTTILWIRCHWTDDFKIACSFGQWWMKYGIAALWKTLILFQQNHGSVAGQICSRPCHNVHSYWVSNGRHSWRQFQKELQSQPHRC